VDSVANAVSVVSQAHSVLSQAVSNEISNRISADNVLSNAISAASSQISLLNSAYLSLVNRVSANSAAGGSGSVTSNEVSAGDAATSAQAASALSQHNSVQSVLIAALSNTVSGVSAQALSANNVLSNVVSGVSAQAASALSQAISVLSPRSRVLTTTAVVSAAAMTTVAGLSVSVDAGGIYQFQAMLLVNRGAAAQPYGYGLSFPAMKHTRGRIVAGGSVVNTALPTASVMMVDQPWAGDSASTSVLISTISMAQLSTMVAYGGVFVVSTTGTVHLLCKASTTTAAASFLPGSYIQVFRMA
jgi:hypothetical protein